ncbi:MarR family winged helix-turn-helix transcriptional regulator [Mycobacteroides chelonae]|uniref:MarR family winged helix-turn-helix transcriptional regulator n=1 Tax=Mycobacteroides chelonae TaxID=1774 RepID=UPI0008A8D205|nr:MarR family winged helix-turn-helix transcriptional regulator [Mycobacteroides chelonae]OHU29406.1 hypothetical protein BKG78_22780 [Mycobacteroides chelonae]
MEDLEVVSAWRAVISGHARVIRSMSENMRAQHGLTLKEFEAMLHISLNGDRPILQKDLAQQVTLSTGGITRMLDRLESAGLVARNCYDNDRRGNAISLTPAGREKFDDMNASHEHDIQTYFGAHLTAEELRTIIRVMNKVRDQSTPCRAIGAGSSVNGN